MKLHLGRVGRTSLTMHPATLVMAAWLLLRGHGAMLLTAGVSIVLHEAAHGAMAAALHHPPSQAECTPLGLLLRMEEEENVSPLGRIGILLAGPCMTALLAWLAVVLTRWEILNPVTGQRLFYTNLAILSVNLLPALPLDGGRLVAALLSFRWGLAVQTRVLRVLGTIVGVAVVLLAVVCAIWLGLMNLSLAMIGCFLIYAAQAGTRTLGMAALRSFLYRRTLLEQRQMLPCDTWAVCDGLPLSQVMPRLREGRYAHLMVLETGTQRTLGMLTDEDMQQAFWVDASVTCGGALHREKQ